MMTSYAAFGGLLQSQIPLPELQEANGAPPDWTVRKGDLRSTEARLLGEEPVDDGIRVQCYRIPDGIRLAFDDTGTFDITQQGTDICWTPGDDADDVLVRADLLGSVFAVALHLHGLLCLHGSAVALDGSAIGFLAPKGTGKSTTAMALCAAGGALVTDDMLAVHPSTTPTAWPALAAVRLLDDSARRLGRSEGSPRDAKSGKYRVTSLPEAQVEKRRVPVAAIYELASVMADMAAPAAHRIRLTGVNAIAALLRHLKTGDVLGEADRTSLFMRAADVARHVPVFRLEVARDFARLSEVVAQLRSWHTSGTASAA
jgi:hypothetical protein